LMATQHGAQCANNCTVGKLFVRSVWSVGGITNEFTND